MPKFVAKQQKSLGRGGRLWENSRRQCLRDSQICWICAGDCPDFKWDTAPFDSAAIDMALQWPHPGSATADHKIPLNDLPPTDKRVWHVSNLAPAHLKCNSARGNGKKQKVCRTSRNWCA